MEKIIIISIMIIKSTQNFLYELILKIIIIKLIIKTYS